MIKTIESKLSMVYTYVYTSGGFTVKEASLFYNNTTQSMRIPKEDQFKGKKVFFEKVGDVGIIIDESNEWAALEFLKILNPDHLNLERPKDNFEKDTTKPKAKRVKF